MTDQTLFVRPMTRVALLFLGILATHRVDADYSVVLGKGISNTHAADIECTKRTLCLDALYVWELDAKRTISGPTVKGRIRAIYAQHTDATLKFVRSVELFVVQRIDAPVSNEYGAEYSGIALSPRYSGSKYCLPVSPESVGLSLPASEVSVDPDSGYYCFARSLVR